MHPGAPGTGKDIHLPSKTAWKAPSAKQQVPVFAEHSGKALMTLFELIPFSCSFKSFCSLWQSKDREALVPATRGASNDPKLQVTSLFAALSFHPVLSMHTSPTRNSLLILKL